MADTTNKLPAEQNSRWSAASFRICGEMLDLEEIEKTLGIKPTASHLKGQRSRSNVVYRESLWSLKSPLKRAESLDKHLAWLLDRLEPKVEEVRFLSRSHRLDFFCGFGSVNGQGGFILDGVRLARIARFGIALGIDLYPPLPMEENQDASPLLIN
jgi:hypothetical protein